MERPSYYQGDGVSSDHDSGDSIHLSDLLIDLRIMVWHTVNLQKCAGKS